MTALPAREASRAIVLDEDNRVMRDDFARFRFLLGATDGEDVFAPDQP